METDRRDEEGGVAWGLHLFSAIFLYHLLVHMFKPDRGISSAIEGALSSAGRMYWAPWMSSNIIAVTLCTATFTLVYIERRKNSSWWLIQEKNQEKRLRKINLTHWAIKKGKKGGKLKSFITNNRRRPCCTCHLPSWKKKNPPIGYQSIYVGWRSHLPNIQEPLSCLGSKRM